ncbi:MAG: hypothetical protein LIO46_00860, partial [Clostridiales bacterium]|nr:hypothetical protein [Clostridiales bacterium]
TSEEEIMAAVQKAVNDAGASGRLTGVDMNDLNDLLSSSSSSDLLSGFGGDTLSLELSLMTLQIQKQMYEASSSDALISTNQSLMDASASTLDSLTEQRDALADGWTADFDGLITEVNIEAGQPTTLLSTGIVLEGNSQMVVAITLGKYDIQKVETGMQCIITVPNGEYQGEVTYIAPTAGSSSSGDIMDSLGSMMGMSGISSLTGSSSGLRAEITVRNPDDKMVIGLDANVEIILGTQENVVVIPIESLRLEKDGTFCFVYDEETDTVEKRELTIGSTSDTLYEVEDGLRVGEKIVAAPTSDLEDGDQVKVTNS